MREWFLQMGMTVEQSQRCEGACVAMVAVAFVLFTSTAHAQFDVPFLDMIPQIFDGLRHHRAIPSVCAAFVIVGAVLFAKTHQISWLFVAIGSSIAIGIWVKQDSLLSQIGYQ